MFLAVTALSEFWDQNSRILFLGPWCTPYSRRHTWAQLDYQIMASPWEDRERYHQAYCYCQDLYGQLLADLGEFLNQVHGVEFGPRYWRILLGPWLLYFIDVYYDRYVCLQEAIRHCPNFDTRLLDEQDYRIPLDTDEFITLVMRGGADLYNLQLYSQILRSLGHTFPAKKTEKEISAMGEWQWHGAANRGRRWKETARGAWKLIYQYGLSHGVIWFHFLDSGQQVRLALTPGFAGRFLQADDLPPWRGSLEAKGESRQALAHCSHPGDPFRKILLENLPRNFPKLYLEGFGPWRRQLLQAWGQRDLPKILVSSAGLWLDESAKLLAAEVTARGGKLLSLQHGGGYGSARLVWPEDHEREISDRFACWGWAGQERDVRLVDLSAPKLAFRERKPGQSRRSRTILVAGTTFPRYLHSFQSLPVGSQIEGYFQDLLTFLDELGEMGRRTALYRGYPVEFGWHPTQRVRDRFPDVALDDHKQPFARRMREARLVVLDYPDTTLLEVMAANVPVVLFFDSRVWERRQAAARYFDGLRQAGILQDTPGEAARQVREIYDRVDEWWFSSEVQAARWEFAQHFARASRKWPREWVAWLSRELIGLGEGGQGSSSPGPCPKPPVPTSGGD
jgi:putative transferase (TIGR04331 family)